MYDFHYSFIKRHVDAELLFADTDSLTYEIKKVKKSQNHSEMLANLILQINIAERHKYYVS